MKAILIGLLSWAFACSAHAFMPEAAFSVRVMDEGGAPLSNMVVQAGFYSSAWYGSGAEPPPALVRRRTDTNGACSFRGRCHGKVSFGVSSPDYYDQGETIRFTEARGLRFEPWNQMHKINIRKILNPIPMYAKFLRDTFIPAYGNPLGYDLMKGDWLPPHGRGETADFIFQLDCKFGGKRSTDNGQTYESTLTLTFSNEGDGIQEADDTQWPGSVFRLSRYAPEDGYATNWILKCFENEQGHSYAQDKDYFFRVRTKKDNEGKTVSSLYGKIRKSLDVEVRKSGTRLQMVYYLNPTPNDRNMEFDPKRNLADVTPFEEVYEP